AAGALQVVVDDDAVVDHQLRGDGAHTRRRRDGEARIHVAREGLGHALEHGDDVLPLRRRGRGGLRRLRGDRLRLRGGVRGAGDGRAAGRGRGGGGGLGRLGDLGGDLRLAAHLVLRRRLGLGRRGRVRGSLGG